MKLSYKYRTFNAPMWLMLRLKHCMRWVRAAGGVVKDDAGNMLLIRRNDRWDLPKGKVEQGETLLQAALREVGEECGLPIDNLAAITANASPKSSLITKTYHIFNLYGGWHLKQTSWFAMHVTGCKPEGRPQDDEGITAVVWVSPDEWRRRLSESYGTMCTLLESYYG